MPRGGGIRIDCGSTCAQASFGNSSFIGVKGEAGIVGLSEEPAVNEEASSGVGVAARFLRGWYNALIGRGVWIPIVRRWRRHSVVAKRGMTLGRGATRGEPKVEIVTVWGDGRVDIVCYTRRHKI